MGAGRWGKCLCSKAYEIFLEMRYMGCVHGQPGGVFMTAKLPQPARAVLRRTWYKSKAGILRPEPRAVSPCICKRRLGGDNVQQCELPQCRQPRDATRDRPIPGRLGMVAILPYQCGRVLLLRWTVGAHAVLGSQRRGVGQERLRPGHSRRTGGPHSAADPKRPLALSRGAS